MFRGAIMLVLDFKGMSMGCIREYASSESKMGGSPSAMTIMLT